MGDKVPAGESDLLSRGGHAAIAADEATGAVGEPVYARGAHVVTEVALVALAVGPPVFAEAVFLVVDIPALIALAVGRTLSVPPRATQAVRCGAAPARSVTKSVSGEMQASLWADFGNLAA